MGESVFAHDVEISTCAKQRFAHVVKRIQYTVDVFAFLSAINAD
jgi:hypothetical protein